MGFNIKKFVPKTNTGKGIKKGTFDSFNPKKYVGERPIIYRSSWELKFMRLCEFNPEIIEWSSESVVIPYTLRELSKITNKFVESRHNYHPDFVVKLKNGDKILIEIKPLCQSPITEQDIQRNPVHYKNARKWKAALIWCKLNNYKFRVINELHLKTKIF